MDFSKHRYRVLVAERNLRTREFRDRNNKYVLEVFDRQTLSAFARRVKFMRQSMNRRLTRRLHSVTAFLHAVACVVSVAMLISFPAGNGHSFGTHFRTPQVRRAIERQVSIAHSDSNIRDQVAHSDPLATFFAPADPHPGMMARGHRESFPEVPLPRLLSRLKLNPSGSGNQDPLLPA